MYVGRMYLPSDNSYTLNLTESENEILLAGYTDSKGRHPRLVCKIVSEPYDTPVLVGINNSIKVYTFVTVEYKGFHIRVLFKDINVMQPISMRGFLIYCGLWKRG